MFAKITKELYFSQGLLKLDASERYEEMFGTIDYSKLSFEQAITTLLRKHLGRGCQWKVVEKGIYTGNSPSGTVIKVMHKQKIYYLKTEKRLSSQIGSILPHFFFENPEESFEVTHILKHGVFICCGKNQVYFHLMNAVPGIQISSLFVTKDYKQILDAYKTIGKVLAAFHNKTTREMSTYDKQIIVQFHPGRFLKKIAEFPLIINNANAPPFFEKALEKMIPSLLDATKEYLKNKQVQSRIVTWLKTSNMTFDRKTNKIYHFDTTKFVRFCGPDSPPLWSAEYPLATALVQIESICEYSDLGDLFTARCKETLLNSYHENLYGKVMSHEGLKFFITEAKCKKTLLFLAHKEAITNFNEKIQDQLNDFENFQDAGDDEIKHILGE